MGHLTGLWIAAVVEVEADDAVLLGQRQTDAVKVPALIGAHALSNVAQVFGSVLFAALPLLLASSGGLSQ